MTRERDPLREALAEARAERDPAPEFGALWSEARRARSRRRVWRTGGAVVLALTALGVSGSLYRRSRSEPVVVVEPGELSYAASARLLLLSRLALAPLEPVPFAPARPSTERAPRTPALPTGAPGSPLDDFSWALPEEGHR